MSANKVRLMVWYINPFNATCFLYVCFSSTLSACRPKRFYSLGWIYFEQRFPGYLLCKSSIDDLIPCSKLNTLCVPNCIHKTVLLFHPSKLPPKFPLTVTLPPFGVGKKNYCMLMKLLDNDDILKKLLQIPSKHFSDKLWLFITLYW